MARLLFPCTFLLFFFACRDDAPETPHLLQQEPFAAITDSIRQQPRNADLYFRRAGLLFERGEQDLAEKDIRTAWQLDPTELVALRFASILRHKSEDSALHFLEGARHQLPQSVAVQVSLARGYQKKGQTAKALHLANGIIAGYPNQLDALILKAELLQGEQKNKEAIAVLEQAYRYAPFDVDLVHNLAFAYAEDKNPKVLSLTDSLIRMDTSGRHAEPYYFKGVYYDNTGNAAEAIRQFNEAIRHDYYFLDAYMAKGQVLYDQKKWEAALKTFQLAATITPTLADAYYWTAKCLEALGAKGDAKLNYQRAYELDKTLKEAREAADRL